MSAQDAARWNRKYLERDLEAARKPRPLLVEHRHLLPRSGLALDVAAGLGGDSEFLARRGLTVVAVDISLVALRAARARVPGLLAVNADLDRFPLPRGAFDVILNFYFLDRGLWPAYERALKPGGLLIVETLTEEARRVRPDFDPHYLLRAGELCHAFRHWDVLTCREEVVMRTGLERPVACLVARRPA
jgi:tellurite methyltransferase